MTQEKQKVRVEGKGIYELPEGTLLRHFDDTHQYSILVQDPDSGIFSGHSVIDSIHTRALRTRDAIIDGVVSLLERNGAQRIKANPNSAVA